MSIRNEYETKTHTVTEQVLIKSTRFCDVCKKEINDNIPYWELQTGHNDWGNDSIDSIENFDICSEECLRREFEKYIQRSTYADGDNTERFWVEKV